MSFDLGRLWELLPAIYRTRDAELALRSGGLLDGSESDELATLRALTPPLSNKDSLRLEALEAKAIGGPLRALLAILAEQVAVLDENLEQLYDDLFIETCAPWVVPYIGDLVGARGVSSVTGAGFTSRAEVADTIRLRRRKGTASMLEQLARSVTSWDAAAVEYFLLLATTQYLNHLRPDHRSWVAIDHRTLTDINTPFDRVPRNADIRSIDRLGGRYNIPNVGIHLFRIGAHPVTSAAPYPPNDGATTRFFFDPLGRDTPLFNRRDPDVTNSASSPFGVSRPILREAMFRNLAAYYGPKKSVVITVDGDDVEQVSVCDLSGPPEGPWAHERMDMVSIDPELGRFTLPQGAQDVRVSYFYGAPSDIGGGEYERGQTFENENSATVQVGAGESIQDALDELVARWNGNAPFTRGIVELTGNDFYIEAVSIDVPDGKIIEIRAANGVRPVVVLRGAPAITGGDEAQVVLNGLLLAGEPLTVPQANSLTLLRIVDCTLAPSQPLVIGDWNTGALPPQRLTVLSTDTNIELIRTSTGPLEIFDEAEVKIEDSVVDALDEGNAAYSGTAGPGAPLTIKDSTVIGTVDTRLMTLASNVIFAGTNVNAAQIQEGCVRFSYVPPGSHVPRRFECQPSGATPGVRPRFTSRTFGNPAYCQLARSCPIEIRAGADDGSEMGVLHDLYQPQREANLRARLDEYLRFGLEAGVFYAT